MISARASSKGSNVTLTLAWNGSSFSLSMLFSCPCFLCLQRSGLLQSPSQFGYSPAVSLARHRNGGSFPTRYEHCQSLPLRSCKRHRARGLGECREMPPPIDRLGWDHSQEVWIHT